MGTQFFFFLVSSLLASLGIQDIFGSQEKALDFGVPVLYLNPRKDGPGRMKRAWVIPPISVSENHKRLPHLLVQALAIAYKSEELCMQLGKADLKTQLTLQYTKGLDLFCFAHVQLKAFALDLGGVPLEDPTDLEIVVMDQNDNRPLFRKKVFAGHVVEGAAPGTFVMKVEATDADDPETDNTALKYSILGPGGGDVFTIDELSGEIQTADVALDREVVGVYNLTLQVADMSGEGLATTATAVIYVDDLNDNPPEFTEEEVRDLVRGNSFSMEVPENQQGMEVGRVLVQDKDLPGSPNWLAKFTILEGDSKGAFAIQTDPLTNDGVISLVKALDFEERNRFDLLISVQNQSPLELSAPKAARALATARVQVVDINEAPFFRGDPCKGSVDEGMPPGTQVALCQASDPDSHQGQELRYSQVLEEGSWLEVDPESGLVSSCLKVPPRSTFPSGWHTMRILASDNGSPPLTATATLSIEVMEVNDHPPLLLPVGRELCSRGDGLVLGATDQDLAPHSEPFDFQFSPSSSSITQLANNWTLSRLNGTHALLRPQGELSEGLHVIPLLLSDSGSPPQEREQLLNVSVCACDEWGACRTRAAAVVGAVAGLSFGALMIILSCTVLLLGLVLLVAALERSRRRVFQKGLLGASQEDLRDNILNYNEQGGGEEDQDAYDLNQLRNPDLFPPPSPHCKPPRRRDAPYGYALPQFPRRLPGCPSDIEDFINEGLEAADADPSVPPYDTALIYDYEGEGSAGGSLSSILSSLADEDQDYDYLNEWGPRFRRLAELYGQ
ncbi:hypothetical protein JD844_000631 [Phrynosoma platyrhinos]|uniref:Cadherin domain-containing protein n=1 Tax=Phrynosoma platyrhinos TaxID=52577 RepID=A0ABQ7SQX0_PHRPL|nr:hypothetical protein JD844_000631 [Phrynosoma platyrhinos]